MRQKSGSCFVSDMLLKRLKPPAIAIGHESWSDIRERSSLISSMTWLVSSISAIAFARKSCRSGLDRVSCVKNDSSRTEGWGEKAEITSAQELFLPTRSLRSRSATRLLLDLIAAASVLACSSVLIESEEIVLTRQFFPRDPQKGEVGLLSDESVLMNGVSAGGHYRDPFRPAKMDKSCPPENGVRLSAHRLQLLVRCPETS